MVLLTSEVPADQVDEHALIKGLSTTSGSDVRILAKQVFIDINGRADPRRSHLLIYALDKKTRVPVDAESLKELLDSTLTKLKEESPTVSESLKLSNVTVPFGGSSRLQLSTPEFMLLGISGVLLLLSCCLLFILLRCCKKKQQVVSKRSMEQYMVGSETAGPRPYNVELITRRAAQSVLANRPLPDPYEEMSMT